MRECLPVRVPAVPPAWEVEPQDASVERGRHALLHCRARGVPPPATVWKKALGEHRAPRRLT